jgi:hypothetical protein
MGLLPLAGRAIYFQPFELTQLARGGRWDERPFVQALHTQEFAVILMEDSQLIPVRWTSQMLDEIHASYEQVDKVARTLIYRPRH